MNMDAIKAEIKEALALVEDAKTLSDFWAKYFGKGGEIQSGGVHSFPAFLREENLRPGFAQGVQQHPVGAVTHAGLAQGTVKGHLKMVCLGILLLEEHGSPFRTHGMGGRGTLAGFINMSDGFHGGDTSIFNLFHSSV